jgi:hypothetical protein
MSAYRLSLFALILALANCSSEVSSVPSESAESPQTPSISLHCASTSLDIKLTPAPPGETLLHRWQRTKADWEGADKLADEAREKLARQTWPALDAYTAAESALRSAQCGQVCVSEKKP